MIGNIFLPNGIESGSSGGGVEIITTGYKGTATRTADSWGRTYQRFDIINETNKYYFLGGYDQIGTTQHGNFQFTNANVIYFASTASLYGYTGAIYVTDIPVEFSFSTGYSDGGGFSFTIIKVL